MQRASKLIVPLWVAGGLVAQLVINGDDAFWVQAVVLVVLRFLIW